MAGFKELTPQNWLEPDPTNHFFGRISPAGWTQLSGSEWAEAFLAVELSERVPANVRELFAVARGALLYGWFYYPLFRLGEEQLYRVGEAAVRSRYRSHGGSKQRPSFEEAIAFLVEAGVIRSGGEPRWTAMRQLRNISSHAEESAAMPPGAALSSLRHMAADIESLFSAE
jgi:hypothetical protein